MHVDLDWKEVSHPGETEVNTLVSAVANLHPLVARLLLQRGYNSFDSVRSFFNPDIDNLAQYGELLNIRKAAKRLVDALQMDQSILLYGDYDVDGTCAVSMLYLFLNRLGANVSYYIPDRYAEGYGVSEQGIDVAIDNGIGLFITLDCGITAIEPLRRATDAGIDVIVCDHHLPGKEIPDVFAILNPQQVECSFEGTELCGCGVGLMLVKEVSKEIGEPEMWKDYLDLTAIATCCDIVPLTGINRPLVAAGMYQLQQGALPGVDALLGELQNKKLQSVSDIVFKIGPRINAAGRLAHAQEAVELLINETAAETKELAKKINYYNTDRKTLDAEATQEALAQVRAKEDGSEKYSTVVYSPEWNKGIIGIVASRVIESFYRPTIVLTESNGKLTGSARSVAGFNLYKAIAECSEYLDQFGGHEAAAGVTLEKENLEAFEEAFEKSVQNQMNGDIFRPEISVDAEVRFSDWYNDKFKRFWDQLDRFRPFGPKNMPVVLSTSNCKAKWVKIVGDNHLKFTVYQVDDPTRSIAVIAFKMGQHFEALSSGAQFKLAYAISENEWNGNVTIQLEAKAIQVNDQ